MNPLDVAIVGAGTAGTASALFLARQGHRVTLYERVPEPSAVGAGIVLQPSGMAALRELGLLDPILAKGARLDGLRAQTPAGRPVVALRYADFDPTLFGLGLHRGVLFERLWKAARAQAGIRIKTGVDLAERDGQWLVDTRGKRHGPHELTVICDGARSLLRSHSGLPFTVERYPYGALWFVAQDPDARFTGELLQIVDGTRRLYGLLPTGKGPADSATPLVSIFWSIHASDVPAFRDGDLDAWKSRLLKWTPQAAPLLEQIHSTGDVLFSEYHDVVMWPWNGTDVVVLGDAAHATSPQLGQGCNLALVDAMVLARCLAETDVLADALYAYSRRRRAHLGWYQFATRWLTPFFQSSLLPLGWGRDAFMGLSCKLPFVRSLMIGSMTGLSRGPFTAHFPPGEVG